MRTQSDLRNTLHRIDGRGYKAYKHIQGVYDFTEYTLLIDENTSATNFMIRDHRMQELVAKDKEPIMPLSERSNSSPP